MEKQKLKRVKNYEEFVDGLDNKLKEQDKHWKDGIYVGKGSDRLELYMEEPTNKTIDFSKKENDDLLWELQYKLWNTEESDYKETYLEFDKPIEEQHTLHLIRMLWWLRTGMNEYKGFELEEWDINVKLNYEYIILMELLRRRGKNV